MSSYIENAFDLIGGVVMAIYDLFKENGIFQIAKGLKALAGMWK
ncbi:hypothetical protein [Corynebacterium diphtheriae]|nr:hypothetical protein [Corynebacterium diphtheriae]CAB0619553.1 hypothetical protein CIP107557_02083 [Corynebacterium diphtheriae]CAB0713205.1 hypothetical protein FRC0049_02060 [Corynebacterium diphtheriae]CAB0713707.1 hypothetical protein FRC0050_02083 [Corynebacterium diphtheriae]CAB0859728.1 hypothetical protein FRC0354_02000 [Corynebacterium diphtheriae]CAB1007353.1 hypothetical protein FRC0501_01946 [Corynebacterium diphtheriae]